MVKLCTLDLINLNGFKKLLYNYLLTIVIACCVLVTIVIACCVLVYRFLNL